MLSRYRKMRQHENVLQFVGACTTPPDLCVVYERHVSSLVAVHDSRPDLGERARMARDGKLTPEKGPLCVGCGVPCSPVVAHACLQLLWACCIYTRTSARMAICGPSTVWCAYPAVFSNLAVPH